MPVASGPDGDGGASPMKSRLLLIIDSDPRNNPRPAEAIRIAAGVGAWDRFQLTLYLHGPAVALLGPESDEFPDGENYSRYLPVVRAMGHDLRMQAGAELPVESAEHGQGFSPISLAELGRLAAGCAWVLRF